MSLPLIYGFGILTFAFLGGLANCLFNKDAKYEVLKSYLMIALISMVWPIALTLFFSHYTGSNLMSLGSWIKNRITWFRAAQRVRRKTQLKNGAATLTVIQEIKPEVRETVPDTVEPEVRETAPDTVEPEPGKSVTNPDGSVTTTGPIYEQPDPNAPA